MQYLSSINMAPKWKQRGGMSGIGWLYGVVFLRSEL